MKAMSLEEKVQSLLDREAIRDCLMRYCHGLDRNNAEMLSSSIWPDGHIKIGDFDGTGQGFVEWVLPKVGDLLRVQHYIANIMIRNEPTTATVETYLRNWHTLADEDGEPYDLIHGGRYLDQFEKRGDEWRISDRYVMWDFAFKAGDILEVKKGLLGQSDFPIGDHYPRDVVYSFLGTPSIHPF